MNKGKSYPDCVRYHEKNNSTVFAVTDQQGDVVAVHEVFLDKNAKEIGRKTTGSPELGYVRFPGKEPAKIYEGEPEDGMKIWAETGQAVLVDVSKIGDTIHG
ncbi:hypothetical protein MUU53_20645 [Rhizobium lemnae]|jgi:hypothetical protein|uniref:Uncharacterized protein n=1 Tax=Rhizobium lemnae TaxID=1214924 RepID=A0ABV8EGC8_9HYPH|nr:hypothetical protein [Rhizobium lemnae]MCJ8510299.1 hypothetical protein [Rhizobium lemnae]